MINKEFYKGRAEWLWEQGAKMKEYHKYFNGHPSPTAWKIMTKAWNEKESQELFSL